jgi:hypothetical protein
MPDILMRCGRFVFSLLLIGTIATNAADPDLGAGDTLTFYKVTGPAWLNVSANGMLSGAPASGDQGVDNFLLLVVDSGGLAGIGSLTILVGADSPPAFTSNPFTESPAKAGELYSATIATNASDPNIGDVLTFSKVSGPGWLNIASSGDLSGLPLSTNAGLNSFVVRVADLDGLSTNATLYINVTAVPIFTTITKQGSNLLLFWSGGVPLYQVQTTTNLSNPGWQNFGSATSTTNLMLSPSNAGVFYRILGQ